ncbi:MAG TPA: branched-chain amino acid ABC transporter permease [Burkholderiales bacterium]|nr:branched-chain amino acid ABC transporter permease [Burkholderiales bacterium]
MFDRHILLQVLWTSLASASFQILLTIAFALVLKVTKIWNFTQPALMGVAFYAMFVAINWLGMPLPIAVLIGFLVTAALGLSIEYVAFSTLRARGSESITYFVFTLIFAQFVIYVLTLVFTTEPVFMLAHMMSPTRLVGGVVVSVWDIQSILVAAALTIALYLFLRFTRAGQYMIAVADNADLAEVYGINKRQSYALAMLIATLFITAAMYVFGSKLAVYPELTLHMMIFAVVATILGGMDRVFAAVLAALGINVLQQLSVLVMDSRWQPLIVYSILFIAIVFFPRGIRLPARRVADGRSSTPALDKVAE